MPAKDAPRSPGAPSGPRAGAVLGQGVTEGRRIRMGGLVGGAWFPVISLFFGLLSSRRISDPLISEKNTQ